ncbi:EIICBA-Glc 2 [Anaerobiospirillum thomasii]|uniref:PTS system glucose-specific EIIA component n=1 Tax=Anaerobiospirillum thomasii TaxID=179995 RepID=A0A2X0WF34_9GAMM|nr:PTS glucose transporter subunit IIA [Anaerobiospirillum thomasii]SPT68987.1 EIICBA-Glc 2 [Anaerobiospirillum thomasii]SPT71225.1 EIICBA-Glc 2 [Anaerobiospirillum thomasii]
MFFQRKGEEILSPLSGQIVSVTEVESPIFSGKVVGDGVAVEPYFQNDDLVLSPVSGMISMVAVQKHAYGITTFDGIEILIHIGLGTVSLDGNGFTPLVKEGDKVEQGMPLCRVNWSTLTENGCKTTTPVLITSVSIDKVKRLTLNLGPARAGETTCMFYLKNK